MSFSQKTSGVAKSKSKFDKLFNRYAGNDNVVDARELKKILNKGFLKVTIKHICSKLFRDYTLPTINV